MRNVLPCSILLATLTACGGMTQGSSAGDLSGAGASVAQGGTGGVAAAGGTGGVEPGAGGAGGAIAGSGGAAGGTVAGGGATEGIPCGGDTCVSGSEICVVDMYSEKTASCVAPGGPTCPGCFVLECDGAEDCAAGESCFHELNTHESFFCGTRTDTGMICGDAVCGFPGDSSVCSSDADCAADLPDFPHCNPAAPTVELEAMLGWRPKYCGY